MKKTHCLRIIPKREFVWETPLSQKSIVVQVGNGVFGPKSGCGILVCVCARLFSKKGKQQKTTTRNKKQQTRNNKDGKTKKHKQKLVGKKTWEKQKI